MTSNRLIICENPLNSDEWVIIETDNICEELSKRYEVMPDNARIYYNAVSIDTDVTPVTEEDIEKLENLTGDFYLVFYPHYDALIYAAVSIVISVAASYFTKQKIPSVVSTGRNETASSPNNELSDRTNSARPNKRIPYIVGTIWSTPDFLSPSYKMFNRNQEIEYSLFCISEGYLEIHDVMEDQTRFDEIPGNSAMFFEPNKSVTADDPYYTIGQTFTEPPYNVQASSSVSNQVLNAPISETAANSMTFGYPNIITWGASTTNFDELFANGEEITITGASWTSNGTTYNLNGTYRILSVLDSNTLTLENPSSVNSQWNSISVSPSVAATIKSVYEKWVGPFDLLMENRSKILCNFVCSNGVYQLYNNTQYATYVDVKIGVTPIDSDGNVTGSEEFYTKHINGSKTNRDAIGITLDTYTSFKGPCRVRVMRVKPANTDTEITMVDEVRFRDLYAVETLSPEDLRFGPVTVAYVRSTANASSAALTERKFRVHVTRKFPYWTGSAWSTDLRSTRRALDILHAMAIEPTIGNRKESEIDSVQIATTYNQVVSYFGTALAGEFCYTFDDTNISFEECVEAIANAIFCNAYRQGSVIRLFFEKETSDSILLFNHRNKIPGSETRTVTFGVLDNNDGVELTYTSPDDDALLTFYIPSDQSAINPKKVETVGVRNKTQAHMLAYRTWNKIRYQNTSVQFDATEESNILLLKERVLITDGTRSREDEGEIIGINGLELTLSQPLKMEVVNDNSSYIWLQLSDGSMQSIKIASTKTPNKVILSAAPRLPLVADYGNFARTTYVITSKEINALAYLVDSIEPADDNSNTIVALNYDSRYYQNDKDYINGNI